MLERKLAEINCILIADAHALAMSARPSLRIDVHAIGDVTQHAKVVLLHRSNSIRLLVGSANLTHDGFRHSRELVATFDFSPSGPLPGHVLASAIDEWLDALGIRAAESVTQALQAASRAAKDWPGRPLSKGRSLKVAFGGGSVPLWRKLVECWPDGEPVLDWEICSPFWPDVNAQTTPFEEIARALDAKGASLRNTNLSIIARPDAHGDSARPKFPFQIVERLRAKNFPVRKGRLSAARLDLLPEESVDTKGGHDRDLHAKYVVLRGPRTSVALIGSANFTCRGFGTAGRANLEAVVLVCGPAEDLQSSWRPPIAQAGSVEWQTCGIGELAEYKSEDEAIAWPTFLLNVVL
jgi:phosphatidylserine/phosphatidylglycerophosphate/cardiolipin synthase-like enzyme